jgi:hypothetical protein
MLRQTSPLLVLSHQRQHSGNRLAGKGYGRSYNLAFKKFGFGGMGCSVHHVKKDRRFVVTSLNDTAPAGKHIDEPLGNTSKTLSPHWRPFGLTDGGVLFTHPSQKQVMGWTQTILQKEQQASGLSTYDQQVNSKIQSLVADNTLENVSLAQWRRQHLFNLIAKHGNVVKRPGNTSRRPIHHRLW